MAGLAKKWVGAVLLVIIAVLFHEFILPVMAVVEGFGFYVLMSLGINDMPLTQFYAQYRNWVWLAAELLVVGMALGAVVYVLVSSAWGDVNEVPVV